MLECGRLFEEALTIQSIYCRTEHCRASGIIGSSVIHFMASSPAVRNTFCIQTLPRM